MIYKHQEQPQQALECLQAICDTPPPPLSQADVWFLIGSVQETMEPPAPEFAKQAYEHVLRLMQMNNDRKVARVYRQLGYVCHKWSLELPATVIAQMSMQNVPPSPARHIPAISPPTRAAKSVMHRACPTFTTTSSRARAIGAGGRVSARLLDACPAD